MTASSRRGRTTLLLLLGNALALTAGIRLLTGTAELRFDRDVYRMVYNDNLQVLEDIHAKLGMQSDSLRALLERSTRDPKTSYLVVSITDHRLWYKRGDSVLFTAPVATASGKELVGSGAGQHWRFETPRGRLVVQAKDENPVWIPPEWYYIEQARKHGLGLIHLDRGETIAVAVGITYGVSGNDVVKRYPDGRVVPLPPAVEGKEFIVNGKLLVPPFGTRQRRYTETLGPRRLDLGDGYGIHGTDVPSSIGHSVSHGCIRMYNADIERLYPMVAVGTPVYIY